MSDLTPEERAGLWPSGHSWRTIPHHCNHGSWDYCTATDHNDTLLYTLDADRLAELVRRYDEAVQTLDALEGLVHTAAHEALSPWADPDNDDWRDAAADQVRDAVLAALAALGEVPK